MSLSGLAEALAGLASRGELIAYGDLARALALPNPGSIAQLTGALEALMTEDAATGLPLRAVLCRAKLSDLPAAGFFEKAAQLGRFDGADPAEFAASERAALFKAASLR
ncbi:hypothetical protein ACEN2J_05700 [Pseudorhodobacter sp. W20_MBD10_FR17]|uniref:hypothetical protein n=1 Tax=Pseudorhodobacter sp. W20_MBD10_FR17 TaxID=3240266 RepID=UPI003F979877